MPKQSETHARLRPLRPHPAADRRPRARPKASISLSCRCARARRSGACSITASSTCSEMSLSSYTILRSEGDTRFIAIPVFPSRVFRHSAVYLRADCKIEKPQDLKGKRIGVGDYQMTAAVWVRGFLSHEYGVRPEDVTWVIGRPVRTIKPPEGMRLEFHAAGYDARSHARARRDRCARLGDDSQGARHDVAAAVSRSARGRARILREDAHFPDHAHVRAEDARSTKTNPWLAISFYRAFCQGARHRLSLDVRYRRAHRQPAVGDRRTRSDARDLRPQIWDYSIEGSRPTLEALVAISTSKSSRAAG